MRGVPDLENVRRFVNGVCVLIRVAFSIDLRSCSYPLSPVNGVPLPFRLLDDRKSEPVRPGRRRDLVS